ncbi:MAG: AarF/ABC1/UbiB kinase family protein [Candidatus Lokiarchaeota archaeon]|nr:AarF/ABC1/UbiB kinase family protein [Candidatus Lokiarchaeota archaeon]
MSILRDFPRLNKITRVLLKHGFGAFVEGVSSSIPSIRKPTEEQLREGEKISKKERSAIRIRKVIEELGPTFVKLGQLMSTRQDLVPKEWIIEFEKLQDEVPPFSYEEAKEIIESELGQPLGDVFTIINRKPIAAGSLAQVHKAELKNGTTVAIKVQRPGIQKIIAADIRLMYEFAKSAEKHLRISELYDPVGIISEFEYTMMRELDFLIESANTEKLHKYFEDEPNIQIPKIYSEYTSKRVLVEEFIHGTPLSKLIEEKKPDVQRGKLIVKNLVDAYMKQIFDFRFTQVDPHSGNLIVKDDNTIGIVDLGMCTKITSRTIEHFSALFLGMMQKDVSSIVREFKIMGIVTEDTKIPLYERDLSDLIDTYAGKPLKDINWGNLMDELFQLSYRHKMRAPTEFMNLGRAIMFLEKSARILDPDFNFMDHAQPYMSVFIEKMASPQELSKQLISNIQGFVRLTRDLPARLNYLLTRLEEGNLTIQIKDKNSEEHLLMRQKGTNRIGVSLLISSIIISSTLILFLEQPRFFGFPQYSLIGYILAGLFGIVFLRWIIATIRI